MYSCASAGATQYQSRSTTRKQPQFRYAGQAERKRYSMLESTPIFDDKATSYAPGTDLWNVLTDEMQSLYLLSLLLTADLDKAQRCFLSGMGECEAEINVFMSWAQARARRTILEHAIWIVMPIPEHAHDFSFDQLKESAAKGNNNFFDAILKLSAFERFVYVMSVLERHSDEDCSTLLRCSPRDVMIARSLARAQLANTYNHNNQPVEPVGTWRVVFANHCA